MTDLSDAIHAAYPHLIEDAIAFIKLPKRCKADLHELPDGGTCRACWNAYRRTNRPSRSTRARAEQGARA